MDADKDKAWMDARLVLDGQVVEGGDYSGMKLYKLNVAGCRFEGCKFERMRIEQAAFGTGTGAGSQPSLYVNCSFDGTWIKYVGASHARFERCSFQNVRIIGWNQQNVDVVDCRFSGVMRSGRAGGSFWGVPQPGRERFEGQVNEFHGNDFSGCELINMDFRNGIDLRLQRLPEGPEYFYSEDGATAIERALRLVALWADDDKRGRGESILRVFQRIVDRGQKQLFIPKFTGSLAEIHPLLIETLKKGQREAIV